MSSYSLPLANGAGDKKIVELNSLTISICSRLWGTELKNNYQNSYLDEIVDSEFDSLYRSSQIGHSIPIFSFFVKDHKFGNLKKYVQW